jgi:hypothetical protein
VLAASQVRPYSLAVDAKNVYWVDTTDTTSTGTVLQCPLSGCAQPAVIATLPPASYPEPIAVDATDVFWTTQGPQGALAKCAIGGCGGNPTILASTPVGAAWLAVDAANLYWADNGGTHGEIRQCAKTGCGGMPTVLGTGYPLQFGVDATDVYWANGSTPGTIQKCAIGGCGGNPTLIVQSPTPIYFVTVDATSVYWIENSGSDVKKVAK